MGCGILLRTRVDVGAISRTPLQALRLFWRRRRDDRDFPRIADSWAKDTDSAPAGPPQILILRVISLEGCEG